MATRIIEEGWLITGSYEIKCKGDCNNSSTCPTAQRMVHGNVEFTTETTGLKARLERADFLVQTKLDKLASFLRTQLNSRYCRLRFHRTENLAEIPIQNQPRGEACTISGVPGYPPTKT